MIARAFVVCGSIILSAVPVSQAAAVRGATLEVRGATIVNTSPVRVTGLPDPEMASFVQATRTGADFHVLATNLPTRNLVTIEIGLVEPTFTKPGERLIDMDVNGKLALRDFDIIASVGMPNRLLVKKFTITPKQGSLDFHFRGKRQDAIFCYIRIQGRNLDLRLTNPTDITVALQEPEVTEEILPANIATFDSVSGKVVTDSSKSSWSSGMPLGGIGTGKLEILPNGEFANITINNAWDLPVDRVRGTFLAIGTKAASGGGAARIFQVRTTDRADQPYANTRCFEVCEHKPMFPIGEWSMVDSKIAVEAKLTAFSPFIPQNERDSSLPTVVLNVEITNPQKYPVSAAVALSWEDINGRGGSRVAGDRHGYLGSAVFGDAATSGIKGVHITSTAQPTGAMQRLRAITSSGLRRHALWLRGSSSGIPGRMRSRGGRAFPDA